MVWRERALVRRGCSCTESLERLTGPGLAARSSTEEVQRCVAPPFLTNCIGQLFVAFAAGDSIFNTLLRDAEVGLRFWQIRRVYHFGDSKSLTGLFEHDTMRGRVSHDVPTCGTYRITEEGLRIGLD